jgi:NADPH2:quinone reductase
MKALVVTAEAPFGLVLAEAEDPVQGAGEVLVDISHSSLNFGDVSAAGAPGAVAGKIPGWDSAGVVAVAAPDGTGPAVGTRVVSFGADGGWAQRRAVPLAELAVIPDSVDSGVAASLPVAGVTALRSLRESGPLLGKRVLVTGASGGVGRFAVQLAARGGAHVIAAARRGAGLAELGAHEVVEDLDGLAPVDVVIDNVGGGQLVRAFELLAPGGVVQSIGWTSGEPATFPPYSTVGPAKSLTSFHTGTEFGADLAFLLELVAAGSLTVDVGWRGSWKQFDEAAEALLSRKVSGKAVLEID